MMGFAVAVAVIWCGVGSGAVHTAAPACAPGLGATAAAAAQAAAPRTFDDLRRSTPQAATPTALQVRVRWTSDDPVANPASTQNRFDVLSVERVASGLRVDRAPQVGPRSLVIVAHDAAGRELDWRIAADTRVVRSEAESAPSLTGQLLVYLDTELLLLVPDLAAATSLRVYAVRPSGGGAALDLVGAFDLPSSR